MANDKTELMKKADALRRDLSELDAQIAKMKSEPESVKPKVFRQYGNGSTFFLDGEKHHVVLSFQTEEQAEKAKAILEKMEFGDPPEFGVPIRRTTCSGSVVDDNFSPPWIPDWRIGMVKVK